jgi:hypothetical protein
MAGGFMVKGQRVAEQDEDGLAAALIPVNKINVQGAQLRITNVPIGSVAYGSCGSSTTNIIQLWVTDILVPYNRTVSNIAFLQGSGSVTDNWVGVIYDSFGNIVASTALAGQAQSGADTWQVQPIALAYTPTGTTAGTFTSAAASSVQLYGPQQYFVGIQINNTSANAIRLLAASTFYGVCAGSVTAGTFGTIPATITPITTFTATKGPFIALS